MRKVAIATASRAERALLQPIYDKLGKMDHVERYWFEVPPGEDMVFHNREIWMRLDAKRPDVLLVPADRVEMVPVAMVAYYLRIPVFHLWAGVGRTNTYDDLNRRVISSFSYMLLCEDDRARRRLISSGESGWRIKVVGSTHADNLVVDEKDVPLESFDLVLVNGNPVDQREEMLGLKAALDALSLTRLTIWVEPSTPFRPGVSEWFKKSLPIGNRIEFKKSLPRPVFLGLMRKCTRFITNSSSAVYEAPLVMGPGNRLVMVGRRNAERATEATKLPPAAAAVADLLANSTIIDSKMLKVYGRR